MNWEALAAVSAFFTMLVIAASAIAALVQLRHLRQSNQLSGLLSVLDLFQQPHMHELFNFVRHELPVRMQDPAFRAGLESAPIDRREHPELYLCDLYDQVGSYMRSGLIDADVLAQSQWVNVILNWTILEPVITICRRRVPHVFENFELLVAYAMRWRQDHPRGNYPASLPPVAVSRALRLLYGHHAPSVAGSGADPIVEGPS
jgi:hypothetical protein